MYICEKYKEDDDDSNHCCNHSNGSYIGVGGVHQTLDEMNFTRGPWSPASTGDLPAIKKYLEKGGEPSVRDSAGYTPLHYSARCGFEEITKLLLTHGAIVNSKTKASGSTPLHRAVIQNNFKIVSLLLDHGADVCAQDIDGNTPLHIAVQKNFSESCELLLKSEPRCAALQNNQQSVAADYVTMSTSADIYLLFSNFKISQTNTNSKNNRLR